MQSLTASESRAAPPAAVAMRVLSDERLARLAATGSQAAFTAIFERHHQALHRYCHSIVGNGHDAADALQNTMVKVLRALPGERREIALKPWLYRIAHNESISLLRARRPTSDLELAAHIGDPVADSIAQSREQLRDLTEDLQELSEQQRGALLMRELGGFAFKDVAGALQISDAAAKQSVYEARCALQAMREGRDMDCDVARRTLSDGDRRLLRATKIRGHLRACAGCRDFQSALHHRPAELAALAPPLPATLAAAILHGLFGGGGGGGAAGGGLAAAVGLTTQAGGALSLAAKVATVTAVTAAVAGGGAAVYNTTGQDATRSPSAIGRDDRRSAAASSPAPVRERDTLAPDSVESGLAGAGAETSESSGYADDTPGASADRPRHGGPPSPTGAKPQPDPPANAGQGSGGGEAPSAAEPGGAASSAAGPPSTLPAAAGSTPATNTPAAGATPPGMASVATQGASVAPGGARPVTPAAVATSGAADPPSAPPRPR